MSASDPFRQPQPQPRKVMSVTESLAFSYIKRGDHSLESRSVLPLGNSRNNSPIFIIGGNGTECASKVYSYCRDTFPNLENNMFTDRSLPGSQFGDLPRAPYLYSNINFSPSHLIFFWCYWYDGQDRDAKEIHEEIQKIQNRLPSLKNRKATVILVKDQFSNAPIAMPLNGQENFSSDFEVLPLTLHKQQGYRDDSGGYYAKTRKIEIIQRDIPHNISTQEKLEAIIKKHTGVDVKAKAEAKAGISVNQAAGERRIHPFTCCAFIPRCIACNCLSLSSYSYSISRCFCAWSTNNTRLCYCCSSSYCSSSICCKHSTRFERESGLFRLSFCRRGRRRRYTLRE